MKILRQFVKRIKDARGAATSLVEAALTISVGAALAGAALTGGLDASAGANIATTKELVGQIAQSMASFYGDVKVVPGWRTGNDTGPNSTKTYVALVSTEGSYPLLKSGVAGWTGVTGSHTAYPANSLTGEQVDFNNHDTIENQLDANRIGQNPCTTDGSSSVTSCALAVFSASVAGVANYPNHTGNYLKNIKNVRYDAWYHKFLINATEVSAKADQDRIGSGQVFSGAKSAAVFVLSAGPDGVIDTPQAQNGDTFEPSNDDIAVKIVSVKF